MPDAPRPTAIPLIVSVVVLTALSSTTALADSATQEQEPPPPAEVGAAEGVVPPQIILKSQKPPEYPPAALAGRFTGAVTLRATVLADGTVGNVEVVKCTHPNLGFEEASVLAIKQWRFEPALKEGAPVEYTRSFKLNFRHSGDGSGKNPYVTASVVDERSATPLAGGSGKP